VLLGLAASVLVLGASTYPGRWFPGSRQGKWFVAFPVLSSAGLPPWVAFTAYFGGMALLGVAWMWLLRRIARVGCPTLVVVAVFALWAAPLAVGPPIGSDDAISYAAAGRLVEKGYDPYEVGIIALGPAAPVVRAASPIWYETPQPYGPLYLRVAAAAVRLGGTSFRATLMVLRLAGLVCLALLAFPLSALARRFGRPPGVVVAAVLCSPLVLVHLVGGAHNEAFMLLPLVTGVAVGAAGLGAGGRAAGPDDAGVDGPGGVSPPGGRTGRIRWGLVLAGVVLCGVASTVKAPAMVGAAVLGWLAAPRGGLRRRLSGSIAAVLVAAATVVAIGTATGLGLGWVHNLDVPQRITTILSPFDSVGVLVMNGLLHLGWTVHPVDGFRSAGLVIGLVAAAACVMRADRLGLPLALGAALLVLAVTTPVVWVWYLTWGIVFVAVQGLPVGMQVAVVVLNFSVTPLGPGTLDVNNHPTLSALFVVVVTAALVAVAVGRRRDRPWGRPRRGPEQPDGRDDGPGVDLAGRAEPMLGMHSAID